MMSIIEKCLLCDATDFKNISYPSTQDSNVLGFNNIQVCEKCNLGVALPRVTQEKLDEYYQNGKFWDTFSSSDLALDHQRSQAYHRVKRVKELVDQKQIKVLDIGAGNAYIADLLEDFFPNANIEYHFLEPDKTQIEKVLNKNLNIKILNVASISEVETYNLIFVNHVLEHVYSAVSFLNIVKKSLLPDGILYVEIPNNDYNFKEDVFPHCLFFSPQSMKQVAIKGQWDVIECYEFGNRSSFIQQNKFEYYTQGIYRVLYRNIAKLKVTKLSLIFNNLIWRYNSYENGIWVYSILKKKKQIENI
jgi:SAM-dependent methyltransferase